MGLVYVFLFLNVKDGPSRFRMASFYAVRSSLQLKPLLVILLFLCMNCCASSKPDVLCTAVCPWHKQRAAADAADSLHCHARPCVLSERWRKSVCRWLMLCPFLLLQFMLVENATLLLAASDFLSEASWDNMTLPTTVLCSFVLSESLFVSVLPLLCLSLIFRCAVLIYENVL